MKAGTEAKNKYKRLKRRTGLPLWQLNGLLESLWLLTGSSAPDGGLGRLSNEDIAAAIEWTGDENAIIDMLIDSGWLDQYDDPAIRFIVHDWPEHAPNYIKAYFERHKKSFLAPKPVPGSDAKQLLSSMQEKAATYSIQAQSIQAQSIQGERAADAAPLKEPPKEEPPISPDTPPPPQEPPHHKAPLAPPPCAPVPPALDDPAFLAAWKAYLETRRRRRWTCRPEWQGKQFAKLEHLRVLDAVECVKYSDDNEYQGIFTDRKSTNGRKQADTGAGKVFPGADLARDAF